MEENTSVQGVSRVKNINPNFAAIKVLFADIGVSTALGFIVGLFLGAAKFTAEDVANNPFLPIIGLLVSVYLAYVLYRRYSTELSALITLLVAAAVWVLLGVYVSATNTEGYNFFKELLFAAAQIVAYVVGWYLAKTTSMSLYIPKEGWITGGSILGGIVVLLSLLGMVALVSA
ncbi:hypothetical protein HYW60_00320 [Candidatus Kaiserbacteria bacterium]|nr:hypothetical protein [Candidatus Kaiserbacteria bacterium]